MDHSARPLQDRARTGDPVVACGPKRARRRAQVGKSGLVFTTDGKRPLGGFSKFKRAFDAKVFVGAAQGKPDAELPRWTLHDLRRTAGSLMSRAGVPSDHAERCLGHVLSGRPRHLRSPRVSQREAARLRCAGGGDRSHSEPSRQRRLFVREPSQGCAIMSGSDHVVLA